MDIILYFTQYKYMQICILLGGISFTVYQLYTLIQKMEERGYF